MRKKNIIIYLCDPSKDKLRLHYLDKGITIKPDATKINLEGKNVFDIEYQLSGYLLKGKYWVPGIIYKKYPDIVFQVIYIPKKSTTYIDLTEEFRKYFTHYSQFVITWEQFIVCLRNLNEERGRNYFGLFKINAPKQTGLLNKYSSIWDVFCFQDYNVIASIAEIYDKEIKEDVNNGKNEKTNYSSN